MKIPLSWLRDYINLNLSPVQIAKILTMAGLEVDGISAEAPVDPLQEGEMIFDISLTPNLGHCASLLGIAKELSAALQQPIILPSIQIHENQSDPIEKHISVRVLDTPQCPRYACRLIKNVTVKPSPEWLKRKIEGCGIRSINNLVDATHFVMMEMGHPLHAFDYDLLSGQQIVVRKAKAKESFYALDEKLRTLNEGDLLVCDGEKPIALAGIIGGMNSEVNPSTKNVLIEAAYFDPTGIRRTSKRMGLITEASRRFERGTDPNSLISVLNRAASLIQQIAGGEICYGTVDISSKPFPKRRLSCRYERINKILGTKLSVSEIEDVFERLGFQCTWDSQALFYVEVPTGRNDLHEEIDLIEEIARIYGFDNISQPSTHYCSSRIPNAPLFDFEREVRSRLIASGLQEFLTCDLIGPTLEKIVQGSDPLDRTKIHVLNPTSIEQSILRTTLLPGLLQVVKYNADHQNHEIMGFEIGRIHFKEKEQYREQSMAALILSGQISPTHWDVKPRQIDFFDLKGILENLFNELQISQIEFRASNAEVLHPGRQASLYLGEAEIGTLGEVHPEVLRRLDYAKPVLFAEFNLHKLIQTSKTQVRMRPIAAYPSSDRDWTLTLKEEVSIAHLFTFINEARSTLLESVALIGLYRSDKLGKGLKNATLHFVYRDLKKTVSQETVDAEHARLTKIINQSITPDIIG